MCIAAQLSPTDGCCSNARRRTLRTPSSRSPTMPSVLGKRKSPSSENGSDTVPDAHEILRRHFEARFKPLAVAPPPKKAPAHDGSEDDDSEASADQSESEWDGLSDDGDEDGDEIGNGNDGMDHAPFAGHLR